MAKSVELDKVFCWCSLIAFWVLQFVNAIKLWNCQKISLFVKLPIQTKSVWKSGDFWSTFFFFKYFKLFEFSSRFWFKCQLWTIFLREQKQKTFVMLSRFWLLGRWVGRGGRCLRKSIKKEKVWQKSFQIMLNKF